MIRKRGLIILAAVAASLAIIGIGVLMVVRHLRTGEIGIPDLGDIVWVKNKLMPGSAPPRTIYLHRGPIEIARGKVDNAHANRSSIIRADKVKLQGFRGADGRWNSVVKCVQQQFAPFDVTVTDERPSSAGYIMVAVGGRARDLGYGKRSRYGGLAPFNGDVVPDAVVFAFSAQLNNNRQRLCETIAMEVAHAYGLDHSYLCRDVMTYLTGCGKKRFVDRDAPCGESKRRACYNGAPTQNSYRHLVKVLGASPTQVSPAP